MGGLGMLPSAVTDPDVVSFLALWRLSEAPVYLPFEDHGYEADFCHVSAKHAALINGGQRVHGWALWQFEQMVLADFHSVWRKPDGKLVDVTPPKWGAQKTLFVEDPSLSIIDYGTAQALYCNRSSRREHPFWFNDKSVPDPEFAIPNDNTDLVRYCRALGLPNTSMV